MTWHVFTTNQQNQTKSNTCHALSCISTLTRFINSVFRATKTSTCKFINFFMSTFSCQILLSPGYYVITPLFKQHGQQRRSRTWFTDNHYQDSSGTVSFTRDGSVVRTPFTFPFCIRSCFLLKLFNRHSCVIFWGVTLARTRAPFPFPRFLGTVRSRSIPSCALAIACRPFLQYITLDNAISTHASEILAYPDFASCQPSTLLDDSRYCDIFKHRSRHSHLSETMATA